MKKLVAVLLCAFLTAGLFAGCTSGGQPKEGADLSSKTDLVFALSSEPSTLTTYKSDEFTAYTLYYQLFDRLIEQTAAGDFVPSLAESWTYNEVGDEITFNLKKGVKFHNGDEMKAEDVAYSYNMAIETPATANVTSLMDHMEVIDDYTCKLVLKQPFGPIETCLVYAQLCILNKKACEADPDAFGRNPVGTGPYEFVSWSSGDKIVLKAFEGYWRGPASIKDLTFKITLDTSAALIAIENGEIDFCDTIPNAQKATIDGNPNVVYASTGAPATWFLQMNLSKKPFDDPNVRKAIACAIDPEAVVIGACGGLGVVNRAMMSNAVAGYPKDWTSLYDYDVDRAKEYLAASEYPDGFTVELACMDDNRFTAIAEIVIEQCRQIGINITLQKIERSAWLEKVRTEHDYYITVMSTSPTYSDADYLYSLYHSDYIETRKNWGEVNDPLLDELLEKGRATSNQAERNEIYRQIVELMDENMYVAGVLQMDQSYFYRAGLKGFVPSATRRCFVYDWSW